MTVTRPATLSLIVAMTPERVIGRDGGLPWHLPEDLAHFKRVTMGHPIIMGRKTYESIGKALPGRQNIVVTRNLGWDAKGVTTASSLDAALQAACDDSAQAAENIFVIGGAQLYSVALAIATQLFVTWVHARIDGDTYFPAINWDQWQAVERSALQVNCTGTPYTFSRYRRA